MRRRQPPTQPPGARPPASASVGANGAGRGAHSDRPGAEPTRISGPEAALPSEQRRKGPRAARRLRDKLRAGRELSPDKVLFLDLTAQLACHGQNVSLGLFRDGETRQDGEPKAALSKLLEITKQVGDNLRAIFGDEDANDPLAVLLRGGQ